MGKTIVAALCISFLCTTGSAIGAMRLGGKDPCAVDANSPACVGIKKRKEKSELPVIKGGNTFSREEVIRALGRGCPAKRGTFYDSVEILAKIDASEIGGRAAMVAPKTGKVYPARLMYKYDADETRGDGFKAYLYKDSFGDVICLIAT